MGKEVDRGTPSARHAGEVAVEPFSGAAIERRDRDGVHAKPAARVGQDRARHDWQARVPRLLRQRAIEARLRPRIDDRADLDGGAVKRERGCIGAVVVGEHDGARTGADSVAVDISTRGAGEHRAGQVVVRIGDVALVRAAREHDGLRADFPEPLPGRVRGRLGEMIGHALDEPDEVAVVMAERGRARKQGHVGARGEPAQGGVDPFRGAEAVDRRAVAEQAAAGARPFVAEQHACAGVRRRARGGKSRGSGADHQHVAMRIAMLVVVGIRLASPRGPCRPHGGSGARSAATSAASAAT